VEEEIEFCKGFNHYMIQEFSTKSG